MISDPQPAGEASAKEALGNGEFSPAVLRGLKIAVTVMAVILVVGFTTLISLIVWRVSTTPPETAASAPAVGARAVPAKAILLAVPKGATFEGVTLDGDRIAVSYRSPAGDGIAIVDLATGTVLTRIEAAPSP